MSEVVVNSSELGNALSELLTSPEIVPGDQPSYELCKTLWLYHPLGKKLVESPIEMAQSQEREITVPGPAEDRIAQRFRDQWEEDKADDIILNGVATSRAYGAASIALMIEGLKPGDPVPWKKLAEADISWSVYDPLNTAGSVVLNQNPLAIDFMKVTSIAVSGERFHRSRTITIFHERPVYIAYTGSAFGFVGRSIFQRALFPLKSYVQSMITDDLVVKKAGVFIAKLSTAGAIIDKVMQASAAIKRLFVKMSTTGNVISIGTTEEIETLNMQNLDGAYGMALNNIKANVAVAADMPAIVLKDETYTEGFGEGTEDAKHVARWVARTRRQMGPIYKYMDSIIQYRAWNPEFFESLKEDFPEYESMTYEQAFTKWRNAFTAIWPNLLTEPDSEKVKTDETKNKALLETLEILGPLLDPANKAELIQWVMDNLNENKLMFQSPLLLAIDDLKAHLEEEKENQNEMMKQQGQGDEQEPGPPKPFGTLDSAGRRFRRMSRGQMLQVVQELQPQLPLLMPPSAFADAANWDENKHPRDKGKFSSKQGAGAAQKQTKNRAKGAESAPRGRGGAARGGQQAGAEEAPVERGHDGNIKGFRAGIHASGLKFAEAKKREWRDTNPDTLDALEASSKQNQEKLAEVCDAVAKELGIKFKNPGPKTRERLEQKVSRGKQPSQINDAVRGGFDVPSPEEGDAIIHELAKHFEVADEGWQKVPGGYFDRKTIIRFPNGQVGEIQMWPPGMLEAKGKGGGHKLYTEMQNLPDSSPKRSEIAQKMIALYQGVEDNLPDTWKTLFRPNKQSRG